MAYAVRMWLWPLAFARTFVWCRVQALVDKVDDEGNAGKEKLGWHALGFPVKLLIRWWISCELPLQFIDRAGLKVCGCYSVAFRVLQLLLVRFTKWNLGCISESVHDLAMVIGSAWFLISYLNTYIFPIVSTIACGVVNWIYEKCSLVSFEHMPLWCLVFDPHQITQESNIGFYWNGNPLTPAMPHLSRLVTQALRNPGHV